MKLPNGYGSVYKLPGNRRRPWAVRITLSCQKDAYGKYHWKYKYLGYYATQTEALLSLAQFNTLPYDSSNKLSDITFSEIFEKWSMEHYPKISPSNIRGYNASYTLCNGLKSMRFCDIRKIHLQKVIDTCGKNYPTLKKLKILFTVLFKYAMENDICSKDYSRYIDIQQYKNKNPRSFKRQPFNQEEIDMLWQSLGKSPYASVALMLIYSGCRISELLNLKKDEINMKDSCFRVTASKTEAGIRTVPIAARIFPFFEFWIKKSDCPYLLSTPEGKRLTYPNYYTNYWKPFMSQIGLSHHRPHDTRHTCISLLTAAGADDKIIKRIVGHAGSSITDIVYTHFEIAQLLSAINSI